MPSVRGRKGTRPRANSAHSAASAPNPLLAAESDARLKPAALTFLLQPGEASESGATRGGEGGASPLIINGRPTKQCLGYQPANCGLLDE